MTFYSLFEIVGTTRIRLAIRTLENVDVVHGERTPPSLKNIYGGHCPPKSEVALATADEGGVFWTKFEHFLKKILKTNLDSASAKATADKSAGQTIFLGNVYPPLEENCPASAFFPPARSEA